MFGFRKPGRAGLRAALLAGAAVMALGLAGVNAGSAAAACGGGNIEGQGSTLQKKAQEIWKGTGWPGLCPGGPTVAYAATGSGPGLHAWGADNSTFNEPAFKFIGTDEAPNAGQITNINTAINSEIAVVPVAQTAIAIVALPPTGCTLTEDNITNHELQAIFAGKLTLWSELHYSEGKAACKEKPIVRTVRAEGSGTTFQFKNYLHLINGHAVVPCTGGKTWAQLQENSGKKVISENPNLQWPEDASCASEKELKESLGHAFKPVVRGEGGGGLVKAVIEAEMATEGRIGYAALPDAENTNVGGVKALILKLENNGLSTEPLKEKATFASPVDPELNEAANCLEVPYEPLPADPSNADWSGVYGANDSVGEGKYPLCTLTWDLAAINSTGVFNAGVAATVKEYFEHEISPLGQEEIAMQWYVPLPGAVLAEAEAAVAEIH